jgi:two-component system chemotaxis sensor kinase CheA
VDILGEMLEFMRTSVRVGQVGAMPSSWQPWTEAAGEVFWGPAPALRVDAATPGAVANAEPTALPDSFGGDPELLREFFQEAREHLEQADIHLLTLETEPENADAIAAVFRAFHTVKGAAGLLQLPAILSLSHVAESLLDKVRQGIIRMEGPVIDLCFEAIDGLKQVVEDHQHSMRSGTLPAPRASTAELVVRLEAAVRQDAPVQKLGAILVESGVASAKEVTDALHVQLKSDPPRKLGEVLVASGALQARDAVAALRRQQEQRQPLPETRDSIKVDANRLDQLVNLIGELVIAEAMMHQSDEVGDDPMSPLGRRLGQMDKITRELQTISMSLRMVPVRGTFQKMARLVRDLAKKFGKDVEFVTDGEDTELDKNVVDLVSDPLMHMVRNAIDHGIESPAERARLGKPPKAKVLLRAYHEGGGIYIDIIDDGKGLDRKAILAKALERGLIQPNEELSDAEIWNLIFQPGFSTAKEITDVSGRGVGMDVVQRNISALRGRIDIRSEQGAGSTFSIRLPLTLAIIDGMAVVTGGERFIIPIGNVVRATRPQAEEVHTVTGDGEVLRQHGRLIPLVRLHQIMGIENAEKVPEKGIVLVLEDNGQQMGLLADDLVGQLQVVIKPLGNGVGHVQGLAGAAIMPDGRVGLILDTAGLFQRVRGGNGSVSA